MRSIFYKLPVFFGLSLFVAACQPSSAPRIVSSANRPAASNTQIRKAASLPSVNRAANLAANRADLQKPGQKIGWKLQNGAKQTISDYKGKVVVLDFWATYCPPCLEEIPHLVALQKKHQDAGLRVIGLNVGGDDDRPFVPDFVTKLKIQYDLGEPEPALVDALFNGTDDIPQTFVFGRDGKLVKNFSGYSVEIRDELEEAVRQALESQ